MSKSTLAATHARVVAKTHESQSIEISVNGERSFMLHFSPALASRLTEENRPGFAARTLVKILSDERNRQHGGLPVDNQKLPIPFDQIDTLYIDGEPVTLQQIADYIYAGKRDAAPLKLTEDDVAILTSRYKQLKTPSAESLARHFFKPGPEEFSRDNWSKAMGEDDLYSHYSLGPSS